MSAFDPKRTLAVPLPENRRELIASVVLSLGGAMRRRDKAGGRAAKAQRPKTLKRRNGLKTKETNIAQFIRERDEAREQQTATAEIFRVIRHHADRHAASVRGNRAKRVESSFPMPRSSSCFPTATSCVRRRICRHRSRSRQSTAPCPGRFRSRANIITRSRSLIGRMIDIPEARDAPSELAAGAQYFLTTGYRAMTTCR